MAEAFCLIFLLPSFVTIMSVVFLKEKVGIRRWSAVVLGFAGVLVVLRPGFRELSIGHLGALVGGFWCGCEHCHLTERSAQKKNPSLSMAQALSAQFSSLAFA